MWRASMLAGTGVRERIFPLLLGAALCFLSGPPAFAQCTPDAYEEDDACIASKTVIHGGDTQSHNFCQDAEDFLSFNACTGRTYTIETSNLGASADTVLELYGTDCAALLASDNDGGAGLASKITGWTAPSTGTFHIKVLQNGTFGDNRGYDITLTGDTSSCSTWARAYDGTVWDDFAASVQQTSDGGFVVAGMMGTLGANDAWVLKLDVSGNVQWEKTYGGALGDWVNSIQQTTDGGYVMAGYTDALGADWSDLWVLKLSALGAVEWQKAYGGADWEAAYSIQQTSDGGYVVAGSTGSFGAGSNDFWVLKLDEDGNVDPPGWQKTYGGTQDDQAYSIQQTSDGKYIVAGFAESFGEPNGDIWILKLSSLGAIEWEKTYGGASQDRAYSVQQTSDGGFVVAGSTYSFSVENGDIWVLKLDEDGNVDPPGWQKTYGGASFDQAKSIQQTTDGDFVVAGKTQSFGAGWGDFWVLKLDALTGGVTWQETYGDAGDETSSYIQQTADGGFAVAGASFPFSGDDFDCWVLKLDANGSINPACPIGADTFVGGVVATGAKTPTSAFVEDSTAAVSYTPVTGVDSTAMINFECAPYLIYDSRTFTDCGNTDGVADPGETIDLYVTVQNTGDADVFSASGVLSTTTPGIVLPVDSASFPGIPVGLTGTSAPFQFIVDVGVPCGTFIDFTLDLSYEDSFGGFFSGSTAFQLLVGSLDVPVTLFSEDFESCVVPPAGWEVILGGGMGNNGWVPGGPGCPELCERNLFPTNYYVDDSNCVFASIQDDELISPAVDTSTAATVTLIFEHDFLNYFTPTAVQVRAKSSNTGGDWTTLMDYVTEDCSKGPGGCASSGVQVLDATSACAGATDCQIEFYNNTTYYDSAWWAVDDVVVEGAPAVCNPACCGLPYVAYDTGFTPTLLEACGDGDLVVEPGEEWQVTVQLHNFGCVTAKNTVADLTVNVVSVVSAAVCLNTGAYGNIPAGVAEQFTYSFAVDSLAACVNDITFDVTNISSDEGAYPPQIPAFTVQVGQTTGGGNEVRAQFTDPLNATGTQAASDFAPDFTLAASVANAALSYTLSYAPIPGGSEVRTTGAKAKAKGVTAEEPFASAFTLTKSAASAVVSYTLTHQKGEPDLTNCTATWIVRPDMTTCLVKDFGAVDPQPIDLPACYAGPGTYSIRLEENCGSGSAEIEAGAAFDVTEVDTGNATDNVQIELIDPSLAATIVKDYGAADPLKPIDVTAYYTGLGTYLIRLWEDAGGTATLTGGVLDVTEPPATTECDAGACGCSAPPPLEPSPPGSLEPLLIPTTADQIIVENVENETGYVVYENAIGTWYGTPSQGCMSGGDVVDLGATVQLNYPIVVPGDRWVVVSAANAVGESSCGTDSDTTERNTAPGWPAPGPCP